MSSVTPDSIVQVASGFMSAKHLYVANEIGLFEHLADGPLTLDELAERAGIPRRTMRIVADAMVALGFVERQADHYQNGPVAATFLSGRSPADLRPFLRFWNRISYPAWLHLEESIRTNRATGGNLDEELTKVFSEGVEAVTTAGAMALAATYDFHHHQRVLDLGGGTGSFLLAVLRHYPHLETTLFELPETAMVARQRLAGTSGAERVTLVEGDFLQDPLPQNHDAILIANVCHLFSPEHNRTLLQQARAYAPPGARLLLVDFWTDPTHTSPIFAALMAGEFQMYTGEGDVYSIEEVSAWLQQTGWRLLEHKLLAGPASLLVAETA